MGREYWLFCYPPKDSDYALDLTPRKIKVTTKYPKVDFELEIGGAISGTVYEADGVTPAENIMVGVFSKRGVTDIDITDVNGSYRIKGILPTENCTVGIVPIGNVAQLKEGLPIVKGYETPNINFVLRSTFSLSIEGKVSLQDGSLVLNGYVVAFSEGTKTISVGSIGPRGAYKIFGLPSGIYSAVVITEKYKIFEISNIEIIQDKVKHLDIEIPSEIKEVRNQNMKKTSFSFSKLLLVSSEVLATHSYKDCDDCIQQEQRKCVKEEWGKLRTRLRCVILGIFAVFSGSPFSGGFTGGYKSCKAAIRIGCREKAENTCFIDLGCCMW